MEVLAALGYGAKELFSYNRENFKFDQDQRLERETLRLEMQVKRFELFREDVHDLVELTVDRMDVYHLVGALFLEFCIVLFCEGRIQASAPPFLLSLFLLSNACAFIYLLLGVWLSMHASIAAHSFGVRLLTRFVRLPIPSVKQINALRSRLKDYESQGIGNLLRLPGLQEKQDWKAVEEREGDASSTNAAATATATATATAGASSSSAARPDQRRGGTAPPRAPSPDAAPLPVTRQPPPPSPARPVASSPPASASPMRTASSPSPMPTALGRPTEGEDRRQSPNECPEYLGEEMDFPMMGGEDLLSGGKGAQPERHIQLFRQLQAKWQCYDAYCRVCMGLGVNQILQGLSYYCICHTLVENHSPTTGYALVVLFQCTTIALAVLDLAGMKRREIIAVQVVGILPCLLTGWGVAHGMRDESGVLDPEQKYLLSPLSFLCQVFWLELWLRVAAPSRDQAKLPRRFRQVLFLDVFGDAEGWDPTQEEDEDAPQPQEVLDGSMVEGALRENEDEDGETEGALQAAMQQAASQLTLVQCALRRWRAVPSWALSATQRKELDGLGEQLTSWGSTIATELEKRETSDFTSTFERELRNYHDLSAEDKAADPFGKCLVGPFEHDMGHESKAFYYDVEGQQTHFEDTISKTCPGALVLSTDALVAIMSDLEKHARQLLELRITRDLRAATRQQQKKLQERREQERLSRSRSRRRKEKASRCASQRGAFPNLMSLFDQKQQNNTPALRHSSRRRALDREQGIELLGDSQSIAPQPPVASPPATDLPIELDQSSSSPPTLPSPAPATSSALPGSQSPSPGAQDQTLRAMAGQHARHFVPERLPWQVLSRMTRVLQVCWFYSGLMALLKETNIYQVDYQQHPGHEGRRLCAASSWSFSQLDVAWPHGEFFRPRGLVCLPGGDLLVGSPFALYRGNTNASASSSDSQLLQLEEVRRLQLPQHSVTLCSHSQNQSRSQACFLVAPTQGGLQISPVSGLSAVAGAGQGDTGTGTGTGTGAGLPEPPAQVQMQVQVQAWTVPIAGEAWRMLAGAVLRCDRVSSMLLEEQEGRADWCLLLVGWDGELLPAAALPLLDRNTGQPASPARVNPVFDAPLPPGSSSKDLQALHLESRSGRLWAALASGELLAWDLLQARSLGRWKPQWPLGTSPAFRPSALCEDPVRGQVFALGRGPLLARADVPLGGAGAWEDEGYREGLLDVPSSSMSSAAAER